jgi:hypothetical protein
MYIEPGSPRENGTIGSSIGKLRDELLNGEFFETLAAAHVANANEVSYPPCVFIGRF